LIFAETPSFIAGLDSDVVGREGFDSATTGGKKQGKKNAAEAQADGREDWRGPTAASIHSAARLSRYD
jgi:hypothetical protein